MLFSVIIPIYNAENYLRECLNSILNQTYGDFEIIAINDGSTDSSLEILDEYANKDSRIRVIHKNNGGVTRARQIGVSLAIGDYVLFVDADDTINSNLLMNVKNAITQFPDIQMVRFKCKMVNDKPGYDHELYNDYNSDYNVPYNGIEAIRRWNNPNKRYEIFWLYAIKRECLSKIRNCPNLKTSEDYAFIPLLIAGCRKVIKIDYVGYNYTCDNQNSLTHSNGDERERRRTLDFIYAYNFLITNMHTIEKQTGEDLKFFYDEWRKRLQKRYNKASDTLKSEFKAEFENALNQ